jgi:pimeloyl-ACP methyl ester carboxylesterase
VLLLHGYPQTHLIWRRVAEALAQSHTVVVSDLRGYGGSGRPPSEADHSSYSKRAVPENAFDLGWPRRQRVDDPCKGLRIRGTRPDQVRLPRWVSAVGQTLHDVGGF